MRLCARSQVAGHSSRTSRSPTAAAQATTSAHTTSPPTHHTITIANYRCKGCRGDGGRDASGSGDGGCQLVAVFSRMTSRGAFVCFALASSMRREHAARCLHPEVAPTSHRPNSLKSTKNYYSSDSPRHRCTEERGPYYRVNV